MLSVIRIVFLVVSLLGIRRGTMTLSFFFFFCFLVNSEVHKVQNNTGTKSKFPVQYAVKGEVFCLPLVPSEIK